MTRKYRCDIGTRKKGTTPVLGETRSVKKNNDINKRKK